MMDNFLNLYIFKYFLLCTTTGMRWKMEIFRSELGSSSEDVASNTISHTTCSYGTKITSIWQTNLYLRETNRFFRDFWIYHHSILYNLLLFGCFNHLVFFQLFNFSSKSCFFSSVSVFEYGILCRRKASE